MISRSTRTSVKAVDLEIKICTPGSDEVEASLTGLLGRQDKRVLVSRRHAGMFKQEKDEESEKSCIGQNYLYKLLHGLVHYTTDICL